MTIEYSEVELSTDSASNVISLHVSGKLTRDDYAFFVPEVEKLIAKHGKIRVLFDMEDFHGWTAGALWQDLKFDVQHFRDVERIAMIGDKAWEHGMATFCRPFTSARIRYFDRSGADEATAWITE